MAQGDDQSQDDRTEKATPFRREESRKKGIVAQSREVMSVGLFICCGLALGVVGKGVLTQFGELASSAFDVGRVEALTTKTAHQWLIRGVTTWLIMVAPLFAVVVVAGLVGGVAQVGFYISTESLVPNWNRLNPVNGFKRLFSWNAVVEAGKAFVKMGVVFGVAWYFLSSRVLTIGHFFGKSVPELTSLILGTLVQLFFVVAAPLAVFAAFDYFYQRYRTEKQMRMTKREVKEEYKMREGDPMVKARIRSAQNRIARRRMMEAVPKADVVVTNPTHFAVALKYDMQDKKQALPIVVAKGVDELALRIRELAKEAGVPLVENKPLARALFAQVQVGRPITRDLFAAVAQVLGYVYRLKQASRSGANAAL